MMECIIDEEKHFGYSKNNVAENDAQIKEILRLLLTKYEVGLRLNFM